MLDLGGEGRAVFAAVTVGMREGLIIVRILIVEDDQSEPTSYGPQPFPDDTSDPRDGSGLKREPRSGRTQNRIVLLPSPGQHE